MFSIENVISSRFPQLPERSPRTYGSLVTLLRFVFRESEFHSFVLRYPNLKGFDFVEQVLEHFGFATTVSDRERERIPAWGRVVIVANHPIGSLDGLALLKMVGQVRPDVKVVANDVLQHLEPLHSLLLPVDNMGQNTRRANLRAIEAHLQEEGAVIIFPAGEVSRIGPSGVRDGKWNQGFLKFATKTQAPILPMFIDAHNSIFFYGLSMVAKPLSTLWLVREMFKHTNRTVRVHIGQPIGFDTYQQLTGDNALRSKQFKRHVYRIAKGQTAPCFRTTSESIAHPEARQSLRNALRHCPLLGTTREGLHIRLYRFDSDSSIMRELGRLREISFRAVGEGSGRRRDTDRYDKHYDHIVLWDDEALEVVGAYRLRRVGLPQESVPTTPLNPTTEAMTMAVTVAGDGLQPPVAAPTEDLYAHLRQVWSLPAEGAAGQPLDHDLLSQELYSRTLFQFHASATPFLLQGVELGRSFVQPRYWRQNGLDLLWRGIGAYLQQYPQVRYLFGPVSLSNRFPPRAQALLVHFYRHYFPAKAAIAQARVPFQPPLDCDLPNWAELPYKEGLLLLKTQLAHMGLSIPPLFKQYTEVCEDGGVQFIDFHTDAAFGNCVDGLVVVDLHYLKASRRKRYLGQSDALVETAG